MLPVHRLARSPCVLLDLLVAVVEVCLFIARGRHSCVAVFWRSSNGRQNVWLEEKHLNESLPNFGCNCRLKLGHSKCVHMQSVSDAIPSPIPEYIYTKKKNTFSN